MSADGSAVSPAGAVASGAGDTPTKEADALDADFAWATFGTLPAAAGLGTPRRGRSPATLPRLALATPGEESMPPASAVDGVGEASRGSRASVASSGSASERADGMGKMPTFDIPQLSSRRQRARAAAMHHHFQSSSFNERLTHTVRNLITEFLPSGANASEAERFAAARGWLSTNDHADDLASEAREVWMVLWSEARVAHFNQFNPPFSHQLFAVVMFPLVCLLVGLLVFAAPFAHVEDGPAANWLHFVALGTGAGLVFQVPVALILSLTRIPMSWTKSILATVPGALLSGVLAAVVGVVWVYPFAFVPITCCFPGFLLTVAITFFLLPKQLRKLRNVRLQILTAVGVSVLTLAVMACWAAHRVGFVALADNGLWQAAFTMLLPLMKFTFRWVFGHVALFCDPDLGPSLVFVVEYFNSIFVATLMTDTTVVSGILLVTYDLVGNGALLFQLWYGRQIGYVMKAGSLAMRDQVLSACWCCSRGSAHHRKVMARHASRTRESTPAPSVPTVVAVAARPRRGSARAAGATSPQVIDKASGGTTPHTDVDAKQCWTGSGHPLDVAEYQMSSQGSIDVEDGRATPSKRLPRASDGGSSTSLHQRMRHKQTVDEVRQESILHRWRLRQVEMIILAEFVEVFTPFMYGVFMVFAYHGWNRASFVSFADMTESDFNVALKWVGALCVVEMFGFSLLCYVMWRMQKWSPLRQLCFVIRENSWLLGSSVVLMFVYTVALIVKQNGCDFTFTFEWMGH